MREADFRSLILNGNGQIIGLNAQLKENNGKGTTPNNPLLKSALFYMMSEKGIKDDDIIKLAPGIISYLANTNKVSKEMLKKHIDSQIEELNIPVITTEPERLRNPVQKLDRRRDALARIIAPDDVNTPCLALAFQHGQLLIAYNSPTKMTVEKSTIEANVQKKINIIREFISNAYQCLQENNSKGITDLINETRNKIFAVNDHSPSAMLPKEKRGKKRQTLEAYYDIALRKLLESATTPVEKGGFSQSEIEALLLNDQVIFLSPEFDAEKKENASLHAEQVLAKYILDNKKDNDDPTYIGISKLCCANCRDVLQSMPEIRFRGSHGSSFPNIMDVRSGKKMPDYPGVKSAKILYPSDSESEGELETDYRNPYGELDSRNTTDRTNIALHQLPLRLFSHKSYPLTVRPDTNELKIEQEKQDTSMTKKMGDR